MPKKSGKDEKKNKKDKGNDSDTSTTKSSTSVDDERPFIKSRGSGSIERRETRSTTKATDQESGLRKRSSLSLGASTSRDTPQSSHFSQKDLVFDPESHASPSKRHRLLPNVFRSRKKSTNPSSDTECSCEDKQNHQPVCPEWKGKFEGGMQKKKSSEKSKSPSSRTVSKKAKNCPQSSSSSDPNVPECLESSTSENSPLLVRDEGADVHPRSSSKPKSHMERIITSLKINSSSDSDGSHKDLKRLELRKGKTDPKSPKGKLQIRNPVKPQESSRSGSLSKKNSGSSSDRSLRSNSKSLSSSDPNGAKTSGPAFKSPNKSKTKMASSSVSKDYNPQGGSRMFLAAPERYRGHSSDEDDRLARPERMDVAPNSPAQRPSSRSPSSRSPGSKSPRRSKKTCICPDPSGYFHVSGCSLFNKKNRKKSFATCRQQADINEARAKRSSTSSDE